MRQTIFMVAYLALPVACFAQNTDQQRGKWVECLTAAAAKYAGKTRERPEVIVEAALGKCKQERLAFLEGMIKDSTDLELSDISRLTEEQEEMERSGLLAVVLDMRSGT
jgi:hypothetical protein